MNTAYGKKLLLELKESGDLARQGIVFRTAENKYLYDTGTGKVVLLDETSAPIINALLDTSIDLPSFSSLLVSDETANSIADFFQAEHLLCAPQITHFVDPRLLMSENNLQCEQLIIELTGKCNLRCKYCTYNDYFEQTRAFNDLFINFETAKKAIDYAYSHRSKKSFAISFYGGEPLLNFSVMRKCIEYCLTKYSDVKTAFAFTTNLTLMTHEIAEYLAQVPNMNIVVSIDGPEKIHNQNRIFANGSPSFEAAFRGFKNLCKAADRYGNISIHINSVLMPPYTEERFTEINDFFESLAKIAPPETTVSATYPLTGSIPHSFIEELKQKGYKTNEDVSWLEWALRKAREINELPSMPNLFTDLMRKYLGDIYHRRLVDAPMDKYCWNGCCVPGNRRLYVCTDGTYKVCEKMGEVPSIGHVDTGIDFGIVKSVYIDQYENASIGDCSNCWAINLCDVCYSLCYAEQGIDIKRKRELCPETRQTALSKLCLYHEMMETNPSIIEKISLLERT